MCYFAWSSQTLVLVLVSISRPDNMQLDEPFFNPVRAESCQELFRFWSLLRQTLKKYWCVIWNACYLSYLLSVVILAQAFQELYFESPCQMHLTLFSRILGNSREVWGVEFWYTSHWKCWWIPGTFGECYKVAVFSRILKKSLFPRILGNYLARVLLCTKIWSREIIPLNNERLSLENPQFLTKY